MLLQSEAVFDAGPRIAGSVVPGEAELGRAREAVAVLGRGAHAAVLPAAPRRATPIAPS